MLSRLRILHVIRMTAFPLALGLMSVFVGGTLNRVMIVELEISAALVGLFFAMPFLLSPVRVWLGYRSDAYPLRGLRREPYIVLGAVIAGVGVLGATLFALNTASLQALAAVLILLAFVVYGVGKNLASNTFEALLTDKFEDDARARAIVLFKIPMFAGIIGGAVFLGEALDPFSAGRLTAIVLGVAALMAVFASLAVWRQEPRTRAVRQASQQARRTSFREAFRRVIWRDRQARLFFLFVMLALIGTQAQDILLEPFGALVLGMSVGQTTRLTSLWGTGTILAMALAGGWLISRFGYRPVLRLGLILNIAAFAGIIASGVVGSAGLFRGLVFVLGAGTGLAAGGALAAVIGFTTVVRAGFLMGVWGVAEELGKGIGSLLGGTIVDVIRAASGGSALLAYGTVFFLEGLLLLAALVLLHFIDIRRSAALNESLAADSVPDSHSVEAGAAVPEMAA